MYNVHERSKESEDAKFVNLKKKKIFYSPKGIGQKSKEAKYTKMTKKNEKKIIKTVFYSFAF